MELARTKANRRRIFKCFTTSIQLRREVAPVPEQAKFRGYFGRNKEHASNDSLRKSIPSAPGVASCWSIPCYAPPPGPNRISGSASRQIDQGPLFGNRQRLVTLGVNIYRFARES